MVPKPQFTMMGEVLSGKLESTFDVYFKYFRRDFVLFGELSLFLRNFTTFCEIFFAVHFELYKKNFTIYRIKMANDLFRAQFQYQNLY